MFGLRNPCFSCTIISNIIFRFLHSVITSDKSCLVTSRMGTCTSRSTWPPNSPAMQWNFLLLLISLSRESFSPLLSYNSKLFNGSKLWIQQRWWWFSHQVVSNSCDPMDCSPPGSSVHEILQARKQRSLKYYFYFANDTKIINGSISENNVIKYV